MKPKVATIWLTLKSSYREEHNTAPIDNKDARRRGALKAQPPARRGPLKRRPPHTKTMNRGGASPYFGWDPATPFSTLTIGVGFVHATVRSFRLSRLAFFFPGVRVCVWHFHVVFFFVLGSVSVNCQNVGVLSAPHEPELGHVARSWRYHARTRI